jgi:hypothetical protein
VWGTPKFYSAFSMDGIKMDALVILTLFDMHGRMGDE